MLANDVPRTLVSDEDIERCFGPRLGQKGRNGPKINNCTGLPQAEVLHLFQVIDGHDKLVNGTLGAIFPQALYAERFLKKRINWAAYAHEKHKNQIRTCKGRGDARPTCPPVVRPHRVYKPHAGLILEPVDSDERTSPADRKLNQQPTSEGHISPEPEEHFPANNATNIEASTLMKSSPAVKVEKDALHFTSGSSCMPGYLDLKNDLAARESRVEVLRADITRMIAAIEASRISLKSAEETISNAETRYRQECEVREKLEQNRATLAEKKQTLEIRLEDGGFDEENPEVLQSGCWRVFKNIVAAVVDSTDWRWRQAREVIRGRPLWWSRKISGSEEGELLDVHPPLPGPVLGDPKADRKRKRACSRGGERVRWQEQCYHRAAEEKRAENARKKAEKDEHYRPNSVFRHRWFVWFTQETNNQTPIGEEVFYFRDPYEEFRISESHLMELAIDEVFGGERKNPDVRPWEASPFSAMSQRLARFLEEVPKNWDKHYDVWLKSREFEEFGRRMLYGEKGEKPLLIIPGLSMEEMMRRRRSGREQLNSGRNGFKPPKSIKDHACTSAKYKACESMSDNTIRFISKDSFTRRDETTRLGFGGAGRTHRVGVVDAQLERSMVFVGIGDLGWAQSFEEAQKDFDPYPVSDPNPRKWIAPELNPKLAIADEDGNKFMTKFSQESDIYALGWLIREMCGDFFTDMTDEEKREYNQAVYTRGLHIANAAEVHGRLLRKDCENDVEEDLPSFSAINVELWIFGLIISTSNCL
ncbi:hypothetical protein R1sor_020915 [Riccia sorocarpa]|uniref:Protein kinase domain-containing protein n=1 Tax=Riccia sorocarpa TaxID=122646 RepID=A0ABD3GL93_9MARC